MPSGTPGSAQHGYTGFQYGCRCGVCRAGEARRKKARRRRFDDLKAQPCMDCGGSFPPEYMGFDHRPGEEKTADVSDLTNGRRSLVEAEIAKCDLVCANCHRTRTRRRLDEQSR